MDEACQAIEDLKCDETVPKFCKCEHDSNNRYSNKKVRIALKSEKGNCVYRKTSDGKNLL